jgi:pantetheine-phosphate adenylyltransferase
MKAILPGSYDPVTVGHLDLIKRAAKLYDTVYAVVFINPEKKYRFTSEDRVRMLALATDGLPNVIVSYSDGLVIDYMNSHGINIIVKGYRNDTDLEYEKKQANWNKEHGGYDTLLLKCRPELASISSTKVREALDKGDDLGGLLPEEVKNYIENY